MSYNGDMILKYVYAEFDFFYILGILNIKQEIRSLVRLKIKTQKINFTETYLKMLLFTNHNQ